MARNTQEVKTIRDALMHVAEALFVANMAAMRQLEPGKAGTLEEKLRFNDSVSALRTTHAKMINRINKFPVIG